MKKITINFIRYQGSDGCPNQTLFHHQPIKKYTKKIIIKTGEEVPYDQREEVHTTPRSLAVPHPADHIYMMNEKEAKLKS